MAKLVMNVERHMFRHGRHGIRASEDFVREVISSVGLSRGMVVADLGSGAGRFTVEIAKAVGPDGKVYAIDIDDNALRELTDSARSLGLGNVEAVRADLTKGIPLPASSLDVAFMANVLHGLVHSGAGELVVKEVERVLRPGGLFVVVDFKKSFTAFGPPPWIRVSPEEVADMVARYSSALKVEDRRDDIGFSHYMIKFRKAP